MRNKKLRAQLCLGALLLGLLAGCTPSAEKAQTGKATDAGPIRIGAILPLTGDAAQYGGNDKDGINLAVSRANASGGVNGRQIEVEFEDCQADPKSAVSALNKLHGEGVNAIIDDAISTVSLAMVPLLEQDEIVLLSTGASNPSLSGASPYFFRIWNSDAFEGVIAANYLKKTYPHGKLAILYINSDYGKGLEGVVKKALTGSGLNIVCDESFDKDAHDFKPQIAKLAAAKPSAVYLVGYAAQTGPATRQLKEAGVSAPVIGTVAMEDPVYVKNAGLAAEGVDYPFPTAPSGTAVNDFKKSFKKMYSKDPGLLNDCGYDAADLLIQAIKQGGNSGKGIRDALAGVKNFAGASGEISFDSNGDVSKPMTMKSIRNGRFVTLK